MNEFQLNHLFANIYDLLYLLSMHIPEKHTTQPFNVEAYVLVTFISERRTEAMSVLTDGWMSDVWAARNEQPTRPPANSQWNLVLREG